MYLYIYFMSLHLCTFTYTLCPLHILMSIFHYFRHDGCLLPFTKYIGKSIPVIWIQNPDEELYAFECTGVALPIHSGGFWSRLSTSFAGRSIFSAAKNGYLTPALKSVAKYLPDVNLDLDDLYSDVRLVLWGADTVLRSSFAVLTQLLVEVCKMHIILYFPIVFLEIFHYLQSVPKL